MIDGTYSVSLKTPMGLKKGDLVLATKEGTLTGKMIIMGKENPITDGTCEGDSFHFAGDLKTAVGKLSFTCDGSVSGDTLTAETRSKKGNFQITGKRK